MRFCGVHSEILKLARLAYFRLRLAHFRGNGLNAYSGHISRRSAEAFKLARKLVYLGLRAFADSRHLSARGRRIVGYLRRSLESAAAEQVVYLPYILVGNARYAAELVFNRVVVHKRDVSVGHVDRGARAAERHTALFADGGGRLHMHTAGLAENKSAASVIYRLNARRGAYLCVIRALRRRAFRSALCSAVRRLLLFHLGRNGRAAFHAELIAPYELLSAVFTEHIC